MAIDYVIGYDCVPKQQLGSAEIMERLKGRERAETIIRLFRENDDERAPSEMGFEFTRSTPEGDEVNEVIVVQDLLDRAAELDQLAPHCQGCPANRSGTPFGCMGFVQYPISGMAEKWLIDQLPSIREPLVWLLLKQGIENFQYDGQQIAVLRQQSDQYFHSKVPVTRTIGEFSMTANQVFEMIFMVGDIIPNHGAMLLLFFNAIDRSDMEANDIMALAPADAAKIEAYPFLHQAIVGDDHGTLEMKAFLHAIWVAWALNVKLGVDA